MESLIDKLHILNNSNNSQQYVIISDKKEYSIQEAIEKGIEGKPMLKQTNVKDEILQLLLSKKRMDLEDYKEIISTFNRTIETLFKESGHAFKTENQDNIQEFLNSEGINLEYVSKRSTEPKEKKAKGKAKAKDEVIDGNVDSDEVLDANEAGGGEDEQKNDKTKTLF